MKKILLTICFCLMTSISFATSTVTQTVCSSGCNQTSLSGAVSYFASNYSNFVSSDIIGHVEIQDGTQDTTAVTTAGITTGADNYLYIYTTTNARHKGILSDDYYKLSATNAIDVIRITTKYCRIDGLQIVNTQNGGTYSFGMWLSTAYDSASDIRISNCIITRNGTTPATYGDGIVLSGYNATIWNNIIYGFTPTVASSGAGVIVQTSPAYIYNNTLHSNTFGIKRISSTAYATNNIAYNNTTDYTGTFDITSSNNLSEDTTGSTGLVVGYGDSISTGQGATIEANRFLNLFATDKSDSLNNQSVGATEIVDIVVNQVYPDIIYESHRYIYLAGYNDMRHWGTTTAGQTTFEKVLYAISTWCSIPDNYKIKGQSTDVSYTGSWTNSPVYGNNLGKYTSTTDDYVEFTVSGTVVYVGLSGLTASTGGSYKIEVDTIEEATGDCFGFSEPNSGLGYMPFVVRIDDLSSGSHTIRVTKTSGTGNIYFDWAGGNLFTTELLLGNTLYMTTTGYAIGGASWENGSDTAVDEFNAIILDVATTLLSDGLDVKYVNANAYYDIDTDVDADDVHPNDAGHSNIADAFIEATSKSYSYFSKTLAFVDGYTDVHLVSSDTDAIDTGLNLNEIFLDDIDGVTRGSTWDLGADEYVPPSNMVGNTNWKNVTIYNKK